MKKDFVLFLLAMAVIMYMFLGSGLFKPPDESLTSSAPITEEPERSQPLTIVIVPYRSPTPTINYSILTLKPSPTLLKTSTPIPSRTPLPVLSATPTPPATDFIKVLLTSPDGKQVLQQIGLNAYTGPYTYEIVDSDHNLLWSFTYDTEKWGEDSIWFVEAGFIPVLWSRDGGPIYLSCAHGQETDGSNKFYGQRLYNGNGLYRFDLSSGKMNVIIPEMLGGYHAFAISPDESQLVYTNQTETPVKIILMDLKTGSQRTLWTAEETVLEIGSFGWSPDQTQLAYTTLDSVEENDSYSIHIIGIKDQKTRALIKDFDQRLKFQYWDESGIITYQGGYPDYAIWELTIDNENLTLIATRTPWPTLTQSP